MAVRLTRSSSQRLAINSGLPGGSTNFTLSGWVYLTSLDSAYWSTIFGYNPNGVECEVSFDISGANGYLNIWDGSNATYQSVECTASTWYYFFITKNGLTFTAALNKADGSAHSTTADSDWHNTGTVTRWELGSYAGGGDYLDGRLFAVKAWTAVLTSAEIFNEMWSIRPKKLSDLWGWWVMFPGADRVKDYSGNGRDWTAYNTPTDEDPMFVSWGADPLLYPRTAGATVNYKDVSGSITPSGAMIKQGQKIFTGGISPAGAISKRISRSLSGAITPAGTISKQDQVYKVGNLILSGSISKQAQKPLSGSLALAGLISKLTSKSLGGYIQPSGSGVGVRIPTLTASQVGSIIRLNWTE